MHIDLASSFLGSTKSTVEDIIKMEPNINNLGCNTEYHVNAHRSQFGFSGKRRRSQTF
jgi:hypothetical protein